MDIDLYPPAVKAEAPAAPTVPAVAPVATPPAAPTPEMIDVSAIINSAVDAQVAAVAAKAAPVPPAPAAPTAPVARTFTPDEVTAMVNSAVGAAVKATSDRFEQQFIQNQRPPLPVAPVNPGASTTYTPPTIMRQEIEPTPLFWAVKALLATNNNKATIKFDLSRGKGELEFDGTADAIKAFKAMATTSGGAVGEHFVPRIQTNVVIEALYQKSIIRALPGLTVYPMPGPIADMPTISTFTASWTAENAAAQAAGDAATGRKTLTAKKLTSLATLSNELLVDTNPGVEPYIRNGMAGAIGVAFDTGGIVGDGTGNNPTGLTSEAGVTATAASTDDFYTAVLKAVGRMAGNKLDTNGIVVICRPEVAIKTLITRQGTTGDFLSGGAPIGAPLVEGGVLAARLTQRLGYNSFLTTVLPVTTNTSSVLVLKPTEWVLGDRQELDIQASNIAGSAFANDQTLIRGILRADFKLMRAAALEVITAFPH